MFRRPEPDGREDDPREGDLKKIDCGKGRRGEEPSAGAGEMMPRHSDQGREDDGQHSRSHGAEKGLHPIELPENRVKPRCRPEQQHGWKGKEHAGRDGPAQPVQFPTRVNDQLMGLGSGQDHAEVQTGGKLVRGHPAPALDQLFAQDGNLPSRAAEADPAQSGEEPSCFHPVRDRFYLAMILHLFIFLVRS